jgi:hypothetical protein
MLLQDLKEAELLRKEDLDGDESEDLKRVEPIVEQASHVGARSAGAFLDPRDVASSLLADALASFAKWDPGNQAAESW